MQNRLRCVPDIHRVHIRVRGLQPRDKLAFSIPNIDLARSDIIRPPV